MTTLRNTDLRKKDLKRLSHSALVEMLWQVAKETDETVTIYGQGYRDKRDLCVLSGGQVFDTLEEAVRS
jgi:hypothetical protein